MENFDRVTEAVFELSKAFASLGRAYLPVEKCIRDFLDALPERFAFKVFRPQIINIQTGLLTPVDMSSGYILYLPEVGDE